MNATPALPKRVSADDRRRQLIEIAMSLFARNGFSGTTTREIARAAEVNEAIIFRFFPHKDDLYAAILERKSSEARTEAVVGELRAAAEAGDDERVVRGLIGHIVGHLTGDPEFLRLMLHSALEGHSFAREYRDRHFAPLHQFLREYIVTRQRDGRFSAGDPEALMRAVLSVPVHHGLVENLLPDAQARVTAEWLDTFAAFVLSGLRGGPSSATR